MVQFELPYSNHDNFVRRSRIFLAFALKSIRVALTWEYDLLFATSTPLTAAIPGILMKCCRHRPFVFEVRDLWPELPRAMGVIRSRTVLSAMDSLEWMAYRMADACVGLSPGIVEGIRRRSRADLPVCMVPNACDLDLFQPRPRSALQVEGIESGDFAAVFTGAHGMANGLDAVLDAAAALKSLGRRDIKVLLIGDGKLKPQLMKRACVEGLSNCIFMDPLPKETLAVLLGACDAGLMILANVPAFYYGTSPNKFFDYIAAGLPVVNNYPGWLAEKLNAADCGLAVTPGDATALANALIYLADHPGVHREMGHRARLLAEREFSRRVLGESFAAFLEQVAQVNPVRRQRSLAGRLG